ncbi:DNA-binding transcriptional regulator, LysR family [Ferrimonas sediminum]|uniref:DNA-binding transcriptional regulator, LysR family n=1 Tax=Ferrimonas sediminum TaxID=718193 RepID=A0A1G8JL73_9GAMM|nr:LysR family transcriptional regulator [Ferrimonas sediminum]SDI31988.1 DNA-binding transcriptional regulator, LysR family [Ferrimonas sediminum]
MDIEHLDYRSLTVFESVSRHLNAGLAANELGMSSSTVSRHMANLREVFQDVLFIRRCHGFVPTDKATQILPIINRILMDYQELKSSHTQFDPSTAREHFTIYAYNEFTYITNKAVNEVILPKAPNLSFEVRTLSSDCSRAIENGDIDFAVVYENFGGDKLIGELISPTEEMYLIAKEGHSVFNAEPTLENLCRHPYFELDNFDDIPCPLLSQVARQHGLELKVAGYTDNLAALSRHLMDTNAIALSCNAFTREYLKLVRNLRTCTLPKEVTRQLIDLIDVGRTVGNYLVYSQINQSPTHNWVKQQLLDTLRAEWYRNLGQPVPEL